MLEKNRAILQFTLGAEGNGKECLPVIYTNTK